MKHEKNVRIQNYLLQKGIQILCGTVSDKMYIFLFNFNKYDWNSKIKFFKQNMWDMKETLR